MLKPYEATALLKLLRILPDLVFFFSRILSSPWKIGKSYLSNNDNSRNNLVFLFQFEDNIFVTLVGWRTCTMELRLG